MSRKKHSQHKSLPLTHTKEYRRITACNALLPPLSDTNGVVALLENKGAYPFSLEVTDEWRILQHCVMKRIQDMPSFRYEKDRMGYHLPWNSIPVETRRFFLPVTIQQIIRQYLVDPYLFCIDIHANNDTVEGRSRQVIHRDILTQSNRVVTYMIMIDPDQPIGTCIVPGTHKSGIDVPTTSYDCSERVSYTHHGVLFDSYVYHYGPATTKTVYKLSMVFVSNDVVEHLDHYIDDLFSNYEYVKRNKQLLSLIPLNEL